jgi:hypothetical protein
MKLTKHYVTFLSPGTFVYEETTKEIISWDVNLVLEMVPNIKERYNATPFGFFFTTRERDEDDFDSKQTKKSNMYFLGGKVFTLKQLEEKADPDDRILIANMKCNHCEKVIINTNSWRWTQALKEGDIILQYEVVK